MRFPRHPIQGLRYRLGYQKGQSIPKRVLKRYLPRDAVILEAGAHIGTDTLQFSRFWPAGQIHSFEPEPSLYATLLETVGDRPNVHTYQLGLSSRSGEEHLFSSGEGSPSSSLLRPTGHLEIFPEVTFEKTAAVAITTIETWSREAGIARIDGMWLDMQGGELAALKATGSILSTIRAIILEVCYVELYEGAPLWPEVRAWLTDEGFAIEAETAEHETYGNVLAVRI